MATHSSILAWRIPWTEEPGGVQVYCVAESDITEWLSTNLNWLEEVEKYTEELYKKDLNDPDNHDGVITHREPDILECEVKWALGIITTNKASRGDGILLSYFISQRWYCQSAALNMPTNLENSAVATGLEKVSFHSNPKEGQCQRMFKWSYNCTHLTCQQELCSTSFKLGFSSTGTKNFHVYKLDLENAEELEIKLRAYAES